MSDEFKSELFSDNTNKIIYTKIYIYHFISGDD